MLEDQLAAQPVDPVGAASSDKRWKINWRQPVGAVGAASYNKRWKINWRHNQLTQLAQYPTIKSPRWKINWRSSILQICAFQLECGYGKLF
ncbi:MAG: hypothetical protein HXX20_14505 [Chloroflexi bacterium]|nr:hypothetical protein [Chloroflexota bacterium]